MSDNEAEKTLTMTEIKKGNSLYSLLKGLRTQENHSLSEIDENIELISMEKMDQGSPEIWNEKSNYYEIHEMLALTANHLFQFPALMNSQR